MVENHGVKFVCSDPKPCSSCIKPLALYFSESNPAQKSSGQTSAIFTPRKTNECPLKIKIVGWKTILSFKKNGPFLGDIRQFSGVFVEFEGCIVVVSTKAPRNIATEDPSMVVVNGKLA